MEHDVDFVEHGVLFASAEWSAIFFTKQPEI